MALEVTPRQHAVIGDTIRRVEATPKDFSRRHLTTLAARGVDFGTAIVPRSTIPAVTRTVQAGSDKFEPGVGTAYLFRVATSGDIEPRLDNDGNAIWKTVYNFSTQEFKSNDVSLQLQSSGSPASVILETQDGNPFDLQADLGPTDYIGPNTLVPFAVMDRSGKLIIPADIQGTGTSTSKIARIGSTALAAFNLGTFTPGTATVEVWQFSNGAIADTATTVTAYNTASYAIPKDEFVLIEQEVGDDRWMIVAPGENTIKGFSGPDGSEILYPYDAIQIYGDRDESVQVGNIIDVQISKAGIVLGIEIKAEGDLFKFRDEQSPGQQSIAVALAATIDLVSAIDETMTSQFAEFRVTADTITHHFGKVFDVTGNTGDVDIFPLEELEIKGFGSVNVDVTKVANTVTATISTTFSFFIDGDKGVIEEIEDLDILIFEGSNLTAASTPSDRGIVTTVSVTDTVEFSVDETVLQKIDLQGDGTSGTDPVFISGGTRNTANFISIKANTVEEAGSKGYIEIKGDANGGVEFILHEQAAGGYSFCILADQGPTQTVVDTEAVELIGSNLTPAGVASKRGVVTVTSAGDTVTFSVDETVLQEVDLQGTAKTGTDPVLIASGTRNTLNLISNTASTVEEVGSTGYIEIKGDVTGGVELILHEQATTGYSFCVDGDQGPVQIISDANTLLILGSNLTAAAAQSDRGIVSVVSAVDTITLSVDQTVHQKTALTGTGTSGTTPVLVSAGTRNELELISGGNATTVTSGAIGHVEIKGDATGGVELILHERALATFCVDADQGGTPAITEGDTLTLEGSNLTAAAARADRGIVTVADAGADKVEFSVDQTVHQKTVLSGTGSSGTTPVLISDGTRNELELISGGSATTVQETGATGWVEIKGDLTGGVEFILHEQTASGYEFFAAGDSGATQTISDGNTLTLVGSNLTAAGAQSDRGITTVGTATDDVVFSVDQTVHQKTVLSGTGSSGTATVLISAGTRNQMNLISGGIPTTIQEVGGTGYIEIKGDATGGVEFILHEQTASGFSFNVDGDQGPAQTITDANTVLLLGSDLTAAAAQADRGIVTVASATDTVTFSVDQTVLQKIDLQGTAITGIDPVLVSAGTRNQLNIISNTASTVEEAGSKGWIEIKGDVTGGIELILHEQVAGGYSFCIEGDKGSTQVITDSNTVDLEGSNLTASSTVARRGVVTTGAAVDTIEFSVDETVAQEINVTGTATTGTSLIQASAGTRNRFDFVSQTASTVEEAGTKGWVELKGDGLGGIEFILHEQVGNDYSFCVDADQGPIQTISDTEVLLFVGSNLTSAVAQADRGIVAVVSATDTVTLSVDETVHQKTNLSGTAATGTSNVLISAGSRNQLNLISNTASTVEEAGTKGYVEIKGDATGGVEFILHEQVASQYTFCVTADKGSVQTISNQETLDFEGSNLTAAAVLADRGIVTTTATDQVQLSVDQSVMQKFLLSGSGQTGDSCVFVKDGTRNQIEIVSTNVSGTSAPDPYIELKGSTSTIELIFHPQTLGGALPIGFIGESFKAPINSGGKLYMDRDGAADTDWAYMDGSSNASPGSGIDRRNYFPRASGTSAAVTNAAFGRNEASSTTDSDEVVVTLDKHDDHIHQFNTDACHDDVLPSETHFDFSTSSTKNTSIQKAVGGAATDLDHVGLVKILNNSAAADENIEMLPAFKKTHYFEKVS